MDTGLDTGLTYEIIGGTLGAIAILIGLIGANRQRVLTTKKTESEQTKLKAQLESLTQENQNFVEALTFAKSAVNDFEKRLEQSTQDLKRKEKASKKLEATLSEVRTDASAARSKLSQLEADLQTKEREYSQQVQALQRDFAEQESAKANELTAALADAKAKHQEELSDLRSQVQTLDQAAEKAKAASLSQLEALQEK